MARGRKVQPDNAQGHTRTRVDKDNPPELEDLTEELFASFEQAFRLFDAVRQPSADAAPAFAASSDDSEEGWTPPPTPARVRVRL